MTLLPFSFAESTAASAKRVASVDASLEALRAELLALQLPDAAGENGPESYERAVSSALNRTGCALLGAAIEELDECEDRVVLDGAVYYRAGKSAGEMMSSFGRVRYERSQYRRRNCGSVFPADARFGLIGEFWSPLAARQGSLGLALVPVKDCEGLFRELGGMQPSATPLSNLAVTMGSAWGVVQDGALKTIRIEEGIPAEAVTMAVAVDGSMLGMRKEKGAPGQGNAPRPAGFREASSGTISLYDAAGECLRTVCYGRMPEAGKVSLKADVVAEAEHCLRLRPDLEVVFIADGAPDNWSFCEEAFPGATQVLDCWHALQHLKEALDTAYGEGSPTAWNRFETLRETLKEGKDGIGKVIRALRHLAKKHPRRKPTTRVLNFFRKHQHRMRYAEVHTRGMPIGSGAVESSNKVLIKSRMKGAGMRWSENGTGQPILTFRALWKSGRFGAAWRQISRALEPPEFEFRSRQRHNILKMAN